MRRWLGCVVALGALGALGALSCAREDPVERALEAIQPQVLDAHVRFLAGDLLEGRAPGTRGIELAAEYIVSQFRRAGLRPAVGDTSYFQRVTFVGMRPDARLVLQARGQRFDLRAGEEFVAWAGIQEPEVSVSGDVVFVGYGITAPEHNWDDYKDVDVSGKVLLVLVNDPGKTQAGRFRGDTLTYYGRWTYKYEEAARRGAAGAIVIHTNELAGYPWGVVGASPGRERFELEQGPGETRLPVKSWVPWAVAAQALAAAGKDLDSLFAAAGSPDFRPVDTGLRASATIRSRIRRVASSNVAAILPGRTKPDEAVVFTSHYDHLGIGTPEDGDSIYNGAYDNASGTALLLAVGDAFARLREAPARSILLVAVTAEEYGLLGSEYYARNPLIPLTRTAANINVDGGNLWGPTQDVISIGTDRSTLGAVVQEAGRAEGLRAAGDEFPEQGYFFRSDQFSFVRLGVPAAYIEHGYDYVDRPDGWGRERRKQYDDQDYHQPSDEYRPDFDYRGAVQQARVAFRVGYLVAQAPDLPDWLPGAEFKAIRDSMMAAARASP
ncbi:MAG: M28 family peptidase [Gemmatimonadetes bacterium]|nr:M28 family peptidase [Gemmatimonadota bacterium]